MKPTINLFIKKYLVIGLVVIGWIISGYFSIRYTQLSNSSSSSIDLCHSLFGNSCDEALINTASWQLGFPVSSLGLVYFGLLGLLLITGKPIFDRIGLILSALGVGASFILSAIIINEGLTCPLCFVVHIINLLILTILFIKHRMFKESKKRPIKHVLKWGVLTLVIIFVGSFSEVYILANSVGTGAESALNQSYKDFKEGQTYDFSNKKLTPSTGLKNAPLQLVVFSSYQCPGCQFFSHSLNNIKTKFGSDVNIEYREFPLSSSCNSNLEYDMQPQSCDASLAAIAANKQGSYWKYHEQLFKTDLQLSDSIFKNIAKTINLDMDKWSIDRQSAEVKQKLLEDITLGNEIGIYATPTVFINGHRVNGVDETSLTYLMHQELNNRSTSQ